MRSPQPAGSLSSAQTMRMHIIRLAWYLVTCPDGHSAQRGRRSIRIGAERAIETCSRSEKLVPRPRWESPTTAQAIGVVAIDVLSRAIDPAADNAAVSIFLAMAHLQIGDV